MRDIEVISYINKEVVYEGELIRYEVIIKNLSKIELKNLLIRLTTSKGIDAILDGVTINNISQDSYINVKRGIRIPFLKEGENIKISFYGKVKVNLNKRYINSCFVCEYNKVLYGKIIRLKVESNILSIRIKNNNFFVNRNYIKRIKKDSNSKFINDKIIYKPQNIRYLMLMKNMFQEKSK